MSISTLATMIGNKVGSAQLGYGTAQPDQVYDNWIGKRVVHKVSADAVKKWLTINCDTPKLAEQIELEHKRVNLAQAVEQALIYVSRYGGAYVVILTSKDPINPLKSGEEILRLEVYKPTALTAEGEREPDLKSEYYGRHLQFTTQNGLKLHCSRVLEIFNARDDNNPNGVSDLDALTLPLLRLETALTACAEMMVEAKVDVYKMEGFKDALTAGLYDDIAERVHNVQMIKSVTNALLLDVTDEHETKQLGFGGLPDLIRQYRQDVAGACNIPVSVLFGVSNNGLTAGVEDLQAYAEHIEQIQRTRATPIIEAVTKAITDKPYWINWRPVQQEDRSALTAELTAVSGALVSLIQTGVITEQVAAMELRDRGLINNISDDLIKQLG